MKELSAASLNTAKQIKLISGANREHATVSAGLLTQLREIRQVTEQNVVTARDARGATATLARDAATLTGTPRSDPPRLPRVRLHDSVRRLDTDEAVQGSSRLTPIW